MRYKFYLRDGRTQIIQGDKDRIEWCTNQLSPIKVELISKRKNKDI